MKLNRFSFYFISFTWGIILSLLGVIVAMILMILGYKPEPIGWQLCFFLGKKGWGGLELGPVFLRDRFSTEYITFHEYGHGIQNCIFGPFMIIVVFIPSIIRYWYRRIITHYGKIPDNEYDDIWFERQATELGKKYLRLLVHHESKVQLH